MLLNCAAKFDTVLRPHISSTKIIYLGFNFINRYVAIVRPLHRRNSRKKARIFVIIIWILSSILSSPCLIYSATEAKQWVNKTSILFLYSDGRKDGNAPRASKYLSGGIVLPFAFHHYARLFSIKKCYSTANVKIFPIYFMHLPFGADGIWQQYLFKWMQRFNFV